jgi:signal transduction histidine kinase
LPFRSSRLLAAAVSVALVVAAVGFTWEALRFGSSDEAAVRRLEADLRQRFADRVGVIQHLADRMSAESGLIASADASLEGPAPLFTRLAELAQSAGAGSVSATVYVSRGSPGAYSVLAWSDGPAEDVTRDRLDGPRAVFVARRAVGLSLVAVRPIDVSGLRVVVAAETVLATVGRGPSGADLFFFQTAFGPVAVSQVFSGPGEEPVRDVMTIAGEDGLPLVEARLSQRDLAAARQGFRRRLLAISALPLVAGLLLVSGRAIDRRARAARPAAFFAWSIAIGAIVAGSAAALAGLAAQVDAPPVVGDALFALAVLGLVVALPVSWWWRRGRRRQPQRSGARWIAEQTAAGVVVGALVLAVAEALRIRLDPSHLDQWQFPLFPIDANGLVYLSGVLIVQLAGSWAMAGVLGVMAARWRLDWRRPGRAAAAVLMWLWPSALMVFAPHRLHPLPPVALLVAGAAAAAFGLGATSLRRYYRRTTQATRLMLTFGALLAPAFAWYPTASFYVDATARTLIETQYAPATAGHTRRLIEELKLAQGDIDRMQAGQLLELVAATPAPGAPITGQSAYLVWRSTNLSRTRVTSAIELYGDRRTLISRFAQNIPEYLPQTWHGSSCAWDLFNEVDRLGAEPRQMLHAERGLCDASGRIIGAVVVHVARDYQALPFLASASPYYDMLGAPEPLSTSARLPNLNVVVYGWGFHPVVASGSVAWPISADTSRRLLGSRGSFWLTLGAEGRAYHVYFSTNQEGVYALGYPEATFVEHLTRLAALSAVTSGLFLLLLVGAAAYAPFARRNPAPLRVLFDEIRTSFYRKLFLFFVLAAIGPVLMLALAFNAYMTQKFTEDVTSEARDVVAVARRVLEELVPEEPRARLTDDVLVWTGRVINQDVNLFEGSQLTATSQRDLFDSGLLPKRTPAAVYRAIALERRPYYVAPDPTFRYRVAASPIPARGRQVVLSVPLALRQREIDQQLDALKRSLLVGAIFVVLIAAGLGASVAGKIADPVARLTRATRQIAAGQLDVRIVADTVDELRRLVDDFNSMAATLGSQRAELARSNQFKAWAEMARQVAHEIKNPLTPIQLAADHLQRVHEDRGRPLGAPFDQCVSTILQQVRILRQIAGEFANFAGEPTAHPTAVALPALVEEVLSPYRAGQGSRVHVDWRIPADLPDVRIDRTLVGRALTNLIENAWQAMPQLGAFTVSARADAASVSVTLEDTGVGMDASALSRAFEPYFSTKTAGSGLGLANARRNIELCGGSIAIASTVGRGTTVTVTLPRAAAGAAATA